MDYSKDRCSKCGQTLKEGTHKPATYDAYLIGGVFDGLIKKIQSPSDKIVMYLPPKLVGDTCFLSRSVVYEAEIQAAVYTLINRIDYGTSDAKFIYKLEGLKI